MHVLDGTEIGRAGLARLVDRALALRAGATPRQFAGKRLVTLFLNPSLRTRTSMEAAASALGVYPIVLQPGKDSWALEFVDGAVMDGTSVEHVKDAVRVLSGYADVLAIRAFAGMKDPAEDLRDPILSAFAKHAKVPVINMESAMWHPLQGLADATTITQHLGPNLAGQPLTLTWAPHPKALPTAVPNQVLLTAASLGMNVTLAHPKGMDLAPSVMDRCADLAAAGGGGLQITHDQQAAMRGAKVVVAKSWGGWSGYADRDAEAARRRELAHWRVDPQDMSLTDNAGFMHCLPVRRNVVVHDDVLDSANSWVVGEAHHRMWTAMALLEAILGKELSWSA
ncbi:MAG: N-acetylornithine carbamoyltransferase [Kiritimatiellia bacterium]